jgi:hypothetical protein
MVGHSGRLRLYSNMTVGFIVYTCKPIKTTTLRVGPALENALAYFATGITALKVLEFEYCIHNIPFSL